MTKIDWSKPIELETGEPAKFYCHLSDGMANVEVPDTYRADFDKSLGKSYRAYRADGTLQCPQYGKAPKLRNVVTEPTLKELADAYVIATTEARRLRLVLQDKGYRLRTRSHGLTHFTNIANLQSGPSDYEWYKTIPATEEVIA